MKLGYKDRYILINITDLWWKNMKKYLSKFMKDNLRDSMIGNLTENGFLQQVQKIELTNYD